MSDLNPGIRVTNGSVEITVLGEKIRCRTDEGSAGIATALKTIHGYRFIKKVGNAKLDYDAVRRRKRTPKKRGLFSWRTATPRIIRAVGFSKND